MCPSPSSLSFVYIYPGLMNCRGIRNDSQYSVFVSDFSNNSKSEPKLGLEQQDLRKYKIVQKTFFLCGKGLCMKRIYFNFKSMFLICVSVLFSNFFFSLLMNLYCIYSGRGKFMPREKFMPQHLYKLF